MENPGSVGLGRGSAYSPLKKIMLDIVFTLCYTTSENGGSDTHSGGRRWKGSRQRLSGRK